jgi:hypothetical protein
VAANKDAGSLKTNVDVAVGDEGAATGDAELWVGAVVVGEAGDKDGIRLGTTDEGANEEIVGEPVDGATVGSVDGLCAHTDDVR